MRVKMLRDRVLVELVRNRVSAILEGPALETPWRKAVTVEGRPRCSVGKILEVCDGCDCDVGDVIVFRQGAAQHPSWEDYELKVMRSYATGHKPRQPEAWRLSLSDAQWLAHQYGCANTVCYVLPKDAILAVLPDGVEPGQIQ